jgi:hypothetical protein
MGRFARNQDEAELKGRAPRRGSVEVKSRADSLDGRPEGMKYFWIVVVSLVGLSAGWMLGQAWLKPPGAASVGPAAMADDSVKETQSPEGEANRAASPAAAARPSEQDTQPEQGGPSPPQRQASQDRVPQGQVSQGPASDAGQQAYDRRHGKARRAFVPAPRPTGRSAAMSGPVRMVLKPFKAINPLKLRRLRPW